METPTCSSTAASATRVEQVADDLVADRRDPDPAILLRQFEDHARTGVRLAGAGGALDGKHCVLQFRRETPGHGESRLAAGLEPLGTGDEAWRALEEQIARRSMRTLRFDSVRDDPLAETIERLG
jgi:hypothetical protein